MMNATDRGRRAEPLANTRRDVLPFPLKAAIATEHDTTKSVLYGVAIAGAALIVVLSPHLG